MKEELFNGDTIAFHFFDQCRFFAFTVLPRPKLFGFEQEQDRKDFVGSYLMNVGLITSTDLDGAFRFYKDQKPNGLSLDIITGQGNPASAANLAEEVKQFIKDNPQLRVYRIVLFGKNENGEGFEAHVGVGGFPKSNNQN